MHRTRPVVIALIAGVLTAVGLAFADWVNGPGVCSAPAVCLIPPGGVGCAPVESTCEGSFLSSQAIVVLAFAAAIVAAVAQALGRPGH